MAILISVDVDIPGVGCLSEFTHFVRCHLCQVEDTQSLERDFADLHRECFPHKRLEDFISRVCGWGGRRGASIRTKVLSAGIASLRDRFIVASDSLRPGKADVGNALEALLPIHGLGPVFASKRLRFLWPELCPVLDNLLSEDLGYAMNASGYRRFSDYCLRVADRLQAEKVKNPMGRDSGRWFAADVEMAVYAACRNKQGAWKCEG
jgi:hypothetical protein